LVRTITSPTSTDALDFINKYHRLKPEKTILLILGNCMVDYRGRARSLLDWGERIILIKQDGTVLVHQPVMREPINWQPADSTTEFKFKDNKLILYSRHTHPPEKMKIIFRNLKLIATTSLKDHAKMIITGMETDVVNQIIENPNIIEEGLRVNKREKHVKSGMIDLFCYDMNHVPVIIEVKRSLATISAVHQLRMYVSDIKKDVKEAPVRGILCAPRVPDMVKKLLVDYELEWKEIKRQVILSDDYQKTLNDF
jgi:RecB family endonuclease NucS